RHTISKRDWSSDVCSSDLDGPAAAGQFQFRQSVEWYWLKSQSVSATYTQCAQIRAVDRVIAPGADLPPGIHLKPEHVLHPRARAHGQNPLASFPPHWLLAGQGVVSALLRYRHLHYAHVLVLMLLPVATALLLRG